MAVHASPELTYTLSDGRVIGLHDSRYWEHQRRLRVRLAADAGCWDYAPLLDVMVHEPGFDIPRFTGKSAAEWLSDLRRECPTRVETFRAWYEALVGHRLRTLSARPRIPDNHYAAEVATVPFVGTLPGLIRELRTRRATAAQWIATLQGLSGRGLKSEELQESGVLVRLRRLPAKVMVSQSQLLGMVDLAHAVPRLVRECQFGFAATAGWIEVCEQIPYEQFWRRRLRGPTAYLDRYVIRYRHRSLGWAIVQVRHNDLFADDPAWWCVLDDKGKWLQRQPPAGFAAAHEAIAQAESWMKDNYWEWGKDQAMTRWDRYALPGADDYQELLIQLDAWPGSYYSRHFRTRNVLVHIRAGVRHDVDGRRVLYLEEIQSDWHAALHADEVAAAAGRAPMPPARAPYRKEWPLLALKVMLWWAQRLGLDGVAWSSHALQAARWRRYGPPDLLYQTLLPQAACALGDALGLAVAATQFRVRTWHRHVERCQLRWEGWEVLNRDGVRVTKPFRTRPEAEAFADLTGDFVALDLPVIWVDGLAPIQAVPLYGTGTAETWCGTRAGTLPASDRYGIAAS